MIRGDNHLVLDNMRDDFAKLVGWTEEHGRPVKNDGRLSYELRALTVSVLDPTDVLPLGTGAPCRLDVAAFEALQLISGRLNYPLAERVGSHGSIGDRIDWQLEAVTAEMFSDSQTRRAVVGVYDPARDRRPPIPSTMSYQLFFRDDHLELHVHSRSTNVFVFVERQLFPSAQLQLSLSNLFNTEPGTLHHHFGSFHLFSDDIGLQDHMHPTTELVRPDGLPTGFGDGTQSTWIELADRAAFVLDVVSGRITDGVNPNSFTPTEKWFLEQLRPHWRPGG